MPKFIDSWHHVRAIHWLGNGLVSFVFSFSRICTWFSQIWNFRKVFKIIQQRFRSDFCEIGSQVLRPGQDNLGKILWYILNSKKNTDNDFNWSFMHFAHQYTLELHEFWLKAFRCLAFRSLCILVSQITASSMELRLYRVDLFLTHKIEPNLNIRIWSPFDSGQMIYRMENILKLQRQRGENRVFSQTDAWSCAWAWTWKNLGEPQVWRHFFPPMLTTRRQNSKFHDIIFRGQLSKFQGEFALFVSGIT